MKRILTFVLALTMILSLTACAGKGQEGNNADAPANEITLSAQEVLDTLKEMV